MKLLAFILSLFFAAPLWAAPTFDAVTTATGNNVASLDASHTVGGACASPILIAAVSFNDLGSVTLTGVSATAGALTQIGSTVDWSSGRHLSLWRRVGATGAQTTTATFSGNAGSILFSVQSYCSVDQTTPLGTAAVDSSTLSGNSTNISINVSSAVGELAIAAVTALSTITTDASQAERANITLGSDNMAFSDEAGAASVTMLSTQTNSDNYATIGVSLKPAAAASSATRRIVIE